MPPPPCKLTFDLLTLKVVSWSRVTWATSVPISVFLGLSVLDLGPMYATDTQTSDRHTSDAHYRLMPPYPRTRTRLGDRSFAVAGPQIWNSLPADLRIVDNYARFRRLLKEHMFG